MTELHSEEVGQAIIREGIYRNDGFLSPPAYELMTEITPIICVDVIPVNIASSGLQIGIIERATGPEAGKPAILGGRIQKNETVRGAIKRHLYSSFGDGNFSFHEGNDDDSPFHLAQYKHAPTGMGGYDPTKHAIAPTYLIDVAEPRVTHYEAASFHWVGLDEIPTESAYNHHLAMQKAADFLRKIHPDLAA
jgi:hypothetical protein